MISTGEKTFFSSRAYIEKCVLCLESNDYIKNLPRKEFVKMTEHIIEHIIDSNDLWKHKRFVRYKDGAVLYSMSLNQFKKLAHDADAVYKYGKMVCCDKL